MIMVNLWFHLSLWFYLYIRPVFCKIKWRETVHYHSPPPPNKPKLFIFMACRSAHQPVMGCPVPHAYIFKIFLKQYFCLLKYLPFLQEVANRFIQHLIWSGAWFMQNVQWMPCVFFCCNWIDATPVVICKNLSGIPFICIFRFMQQHYNTTPSLYLHVCVN